MSRLVTVPNPGAGRAAAVGWLVGRTGHPAAGTRVLTCEDEQGEEGPAQRRWGPWGSRQLAALEHRREGGPRGAAPMPPRPLPLPGLQARAGVGGQEFPPGGPNGGQMAKPAPGASGLKKVSKAPVPYQPGMGAHAAGAP